VSGVSKSGLVDNDRCALRSGIAFNGFAVVIGIEEVHERIEPHPVGEFQAIHVTPGDEFRMSPKSSELHAVCEQGYLAIAADVDPDFRGIVVDYKNRGVRCKRAPTQEPSEDTAGNE